MTNIIRKPLRPKEGAVAQMREDQDVVGKCVSQSAMYAASGSCMLNGSEDMFHTGQRSRPPWTI